MDFKLIGKFLAWYNKVLLRRSSVLKIKRIIGGILESNGYIISSQEKHDNCFIIDPGYSPKKFIKYVRENDLEAKAIILTHHHPDHVGGAERISKELGSPVMIHQLDADYYGKKADVHLENGDVLETGDGEKGIELLVLNTPGHTRGSICLMAEKDKVCFTGDTIFNIDLGRTDLGDGSYREMIQSITEIVDKWADDITIYPGHGDPATMKTVRKINLEYLEIMKEYNKQEQR